MSSFPASMMTIIFSFFFFVLPLSFVHDRCNVPAWPKPTHDWQHVPRDKYTTMPVSPVPPRPPAQRDAGKNYTTLAFILFERQMVPSAQRSAGKIPAPPTYDFSMAPIASPERRSAGKNSLTASSTPKTSFALASVVTSFPASPAEGTLPLAQHVQDARSAVAEPTSQAPANSTLSVGRALRPSANSWRLPGRVHGHISGISLKQFSDRFGRLTSDFHHMFLGAHRSISPLLGQCTAAMGGLLWHMAPKMQVTPRCQLPDSVA